ncbi:phage Mu F like family protein [Elysia marginata]|uniref:Phage Mu F like family protein n=1 Tax=Elysia marginata TaxID=1093978 RepID=A0AAV4GFZ9_9GAST|nr:phage Mu F like family protein [Elysia marginata]
MQDVGAAAWFIIDNEEHFEFAKATANASGDVYKNLINLCNNEISMAVSGAIIGQDTLHGNRSKEQAAQKLLDNLVQSDMTMVKNYWNTTVLPALISIGLIPAGDYSPDTIGAEIEQLYLSYPTESQSLSIPQIAEIDKTIDKALKSLFGGEKKTLLKALYQITNKSLQNAITGVFGLDYRPNPELLVKLQRNVAVFSAFKAHRQSLLIHSLLIDQKGQPRSFSTFYPLAKKLSDQWNKHWLRTEYNTATIRARTAQQFDAFQKTKNIYPNLEWIASRAAQPRDSHRKLWGMIKPIDHPFWSTHYPGNIWNCKCSLQRTDKAPTQIQKRYAPKPAKGIDKNPFSGEIFTTTHPYIAKTIQDIEKQVERYGKNEFLKIHQTQHLVALKKLPQKHKINTLKLQNKTIQIELNNKVTKRLLHKNQKAFNAGDMDSFVQQNTMLYEFKSLEFEYLNSAKHVKKNAKADFVKAWHYFGFEYQKKRYKLNLYETETGDFVVNEMNRIKKEAKK